MDYFKILSLDREPFSNTPDPDFYFNSRQHTLCFQKLEIALRLKRGLNVVIGDIGTGKTTLCRKLIQTFSRDPGSECHLILDPYYDNADDFLTEIATVFNGNRNISGGRKIKEVIKQAIFNKAKVQNKKLILIIDEGQKLTLFCLEILRELLNFETNDHKLLQIVIFAQQEFSQSLDQMPNFADRINLLHVLGPMSFTDTSKMIRFRTRQACSTGITPRIFSLPAILAIHFSTKGHPRKIINICHQCILAMIIQNRSKIGWFQSRACIRRTVLPCTQKKHPVLKTATAIFTALIIVLIAGSIEIRRFIHPVTTPVKSFTVMDIHHDAGRMIPSDLSANTNRSSDHHQAFEQPPIEIIIPEESSEMTNTQETKAFPLASTKRPLESPPLLPSGEIQDLDIIQTSESNSIEPAATAAPLPTVLGTVVVRKSDTLGAIISAIYASYKSSTVKTILKINPHILDPNNINAGDKIQFPVIAQAMVPDGNRFRWIKIGDADTLSDAVEKIVYAAGKDVPLRIAAILLPDRAFLYDILLKTYFSSDLAANKIIRLLPPELSKNAEIISKWPEGAVVMSNLLSGGQNTTDG